MDPAPREAMRMIPMRLSVYRVSLTLGVFAILTGIVIGTLGLTGDDRFAAEDIQFAAASLALGAWFTLWALLGGRIRGIESDNALSWPRLVGTLGLGILGMYGALTLFGVIPGLLVGVVFLWLSWHRPKE